MAQEVQEWIQKWDDDPMVVSVGDPSTKSGGFFSSKKTLFVVRASSREKLTSVSREFKDFVLLHQLLVSRFRGACVPPMPQKTIGSTMKANEEDFITKRMHFLEYFLQAIVENPFLRTDITFELFITRTEDYEKVMKNFDKTTDSPGLSMWRKALDSALEPEDPEKMLKDIDKELDVLLKSLENLKDVSKAHVNAIIKYAESMKSLAVAFESWQAREEANISILRGVNTRVDGTKAILAHELKAIVQGTEATASVIQLEYGASQLELIVVDAVRFEIAQAKRWQLQVKETADKVKQHNSSKTDVVRQQQQLGKLTQSNKADNDKAIKMASDLLTKAKQREKDLSAERSDHVRGLLQIELERYRKQRTVRIEAMTALLTRTNLRGANMIKCAWDGTGLEVEGPPPSQQRPVTNGSFGFRRRSFTRTPSGRLRVKGTDGNLEHELRREASTMAAPRNLAITQDEHKVTLKAKKDYLAKKKDELDLKAGELVTAVRIDDEFWYATNAQGRSGLVPSSYVGVPPADGGSNSNRSSLILSAGVVATPSPTASESARSDSNAGEGEIQPGSSPSSFSPITSAPPGMAPPPPPGVPPLPPPSRDPNIPLNIPEGVSPSSGEHGPPQPPRLPEFMTRKGSGRFNADLPPLPRNVEAMAALKAKLMSLTS